MLLAGLLLRADARDFQAYSLEWLADTSATIGIYDATMVVSEQPNYFTLSLQLEKPIKGESPSLVSAKYWGYPTRQGSSVPLINVPIVNEGDRLLVFQKRDEKNALQVCQLINLSTAVEAKLEPNEIALDARGQPPEKGKILEIVQQRLSSHPEAKTMIADDLGDYASRYDVDLSGLASGPPLYLGMSACFLMVPEDLKPKERSPISEAFRQWQKAHPERPLF